MSNRGDYRPIYSVLPDSPEYEVLSKNASLLLVMVKLSLGPAGIGVLSNDTLQHRAKLEDGELVPARDELIAAGWIEVQGRVWWLRNGLRFEPTMRLTNENHRGFIIRFLNSLPKLQIVNRMALYYGLPEPFPTLNGMASPIPSGMASPKASPMATGITEPLTLTLTEPLTETETETEDRAVDVAREPEPKPELPVGRSVDSLRSDGGTPNGAPWPAGVPNPLAAFSEIAGKLAAMQLPGGYLPAAELVRDRWLWPDEGEGPGSAADFALADFALPDRTRIVLEAIGDYRAKHPAFDPRLFAGFVRRIAEPRLTGPTNGNGAGHGDQHGIVKRHLAIAPDEAPEPTAEERAAGRALVAAAIKPPPEPELNPTIDDAEVIAARESEAQRQRGLLAAAGVLRPVKS